MKKSVLILGVWALSASGATLEPTERLVTLLGTNDLHGSMENLALWSAHVKATRAGLQKQYGENAGTLVLDGGDQFQGELDSNYDEGESVYRAMNAVGYDAVVPGNHDFDFGPQGWLEDRVSERTEDKNPRGAFLKILKMAKFSVLSANLYYKRSFFELTTGNPLEVTGVGCKANGDIDWNKTVRSEFVKPYQIFERAGVRVAVVGLDHNKTPTTTTEVNVNDLCFGDEAEAYVRVINEIRDHADLFVIVMHNGDVPNYEKEKKGEYKSEDGTNVVKKIQELGAPLHAVIAGHTHQDNRRWIEGVPLIQSHSNGTAYGRIDLIYDVEKKSLVRSKTKMYSSLAIKMKKCPKFNPEFCTLDPVTGSVLIEGEPLVEDETVKAITDSALRNVAPVADQRVAYAERGMDRHRFNESPLIDWLTDAFRLATRTQIAFMNSGGIRENLPKGQITYRHIFKIIPFNNRAITIETINGSELQALLAKSITSCGKFGALMQSGLKVEFTKNCGEGDLDLNAALTKVMTLDGTVLLDVTAGIKEIDPRYTFKIATLDFLASGASEFGSFSSPTSGATYSDIGIAREIIIDYLKANPMNLGHYPDGRWKNISDQR